MKITFYLHDLFYEIGHANVTLNTLNHIQGLDEYDIKFVVFKSDKIENLLIKPCNNIQVHYVPFPNIKPVLLKVIWFHIYTFVYSLIRDKNRLKVSLGIANMNCDISIIHFLHNQWSKDYFKIIKPRGIVKLYKKIHYFYVDIMERALFKLKSPHLITVSEFMKTYIHDNFEYESSAVTAIHSGFDLNRFASSDMSYNEIVQKLKTNGTDLDAVNFEKPVCLFIGAFERKGLEILLSQWNQKKDAHLIIIGQSEVGSNFNYANKENITHIKYTKDINLFYEIADYFLFPTIYEPFGMVLIEAAIKGLKIISSKKNVGASEVLEGQEEIFFSKEASSFKLPQQMTKVSQVEKDKLILKRKASLSDYQWSAVSKKYDKQFKDMK